MNTSSNPMIEMRNVGKSFGAHRVLRGINLDVHSGEVLVLKGAAGGVTGVTGATGSVCPVYGAGSVIPSGYRSRGPNWS